MVCTKNISENIVNKLFKRKLITIKKRIKMYKYLINEFTCIAYTNFLLFLILNLLLKIDPYIIECTLYIPLFIYIDRMI